MLKICKICIQPNTRPGIFFNSSGICGACIWESEKNKINWDLREKELLNIAYSAKKNSKNNYNCVIGVSGGKDSTTQAIIARDKLNLNCLLVNCEPDNITSLGKRNIENLKHLGFDVISIRPNPKIMKKLMKVDFYNYLNPIKITEFALYSSAYIIAEKFNIPLIIQGENPGLTLGVSKTGVGTSNDALQADKLNTLSNGIDEYLNVDGITKNDLTLFQYDKLQLQKKGIKAIWLNYYYKNWSQRGNAEFAKNYGFNFRKNNFDPITIGSYSRFSALDSDFQPVNQMLKFFKFGFGQTMDMACYDLREKRISRKEAIDLVMKYDGKCSLLYVKKFCKYLDIDENDFWKTSEKFRGKMWKKNSRNQWKNMIWDLF